jgi:hypothetical protein
MIARLKLLSIITFAACIALGTAGCVQTIYSKSVEVKRDATGKVIETVEKEEVSQPGQQSKHIGFEHLRARSGDATPMTPK